MWYSIVLAPSLLGAVTDVRHPVWPVRGGSVASYQSVVAPLLAMDERKMAALVPTQSGIYFCGCPNCTGGRQEGQFADEGDLPRPWSIDRPDEIRCKYCGHVYPSAKYPMEKRLEVKNPRGETQVYPYWEDAKGYRYFLGARIDDRKIRYLEESALRLARGYALSGDKACARRAGILLLRFAEVFPGHCYHFDYPFQQKEIYAGPVAPKDLRAGFRTARWTWWAYMDIPAQLLEAYDLVAASGELEKLSQETRKDVTAEIERFFTQAVDGVLANPEPFTNMSPGMWADFIRAGRILGRPEYVHVALDRLEQFTTSRFFYDGVWEEGTPSYHSQVLGNLSNLFQVARGYSDPPGYADKTGRRCDDLDVSRNFPVVASAQRYLDLMCLPDGRLVPVHDTWWSHKHRVPQESKPFLLGGLGHACLARGGGARQVQAHLTWSPGYGHAHNDGLSLILFAHGKELLSDLGYTHTRERAITVPTVSHNTVVVDGKNQLAGRDQASTYGSLRYCDTRNAACQIVSVDNPEVYRGTVTRYRRTLALVAAEESAGYLVDVFQVRGGAQHDYFLHGSADERQKVAVSLDGKPLPLEPVTSLLPAGVRFAPARNEGEGYDEIAKQPGYAYGYLGDLRGARLDRAGVCALEYTLDGQPVALRAYVDAGAGDQVMAGTGPAVRGANEDDAQLAGCRRAFTLVRRPGGDSTFLSVIEPVNGTPVLAGVKRLEVAGSERALGITLAGGGRDLLLWNARGVTAVWNGHPLSAEGELVLLRTREGKPLGATVAGGKVEWNGLRVAAGPAADPRLLQVDRAGRSLLVEGAFTPAEGSVIAVGHAGQRVSAYTVASARPEGANTRIVLVEDPGFTWDAPAGKATFLCAPQAAFTGEHRVRQVAVAHG